ncbi:hypothetical protein NHQ30_002677 [Ciborinia camelliae]|nr:hypothetical protein NHQ30_002677 [Ciborinia camelliae]
MTSSPRKSVLPLILGGWLLVNYLILAVCGKITLETVRNLTGVTRECRGMIEGLEEGAGGDGGGEGGRGIDRGGQFHGRGGEEIGRAQMVLSGGPQDGDEVEDNYSPTSHSQQTITAALRILCSDLLMELEKPLLSSDSSPENILYDCPRVKKDFDDFLKETTWFLYEIQERQMRWRWGGESANSQERSFIEQQMELYRNTGCFEKLNREVLRKDIEVVEYLNDLIDMF